MDRAELAARLGREGVPDALYDIPGVHAVPFQLDAYYFLRPEGDDWLVGLRQRSRDTVLGRFATEAAACDRLYVELAQVPPPVPGAAERVARLLAHREEIQRQAWEDFERAPRPGGDADDARGGEGEGDEGEGDDPHGT